MSQISQLLEKCSGCHACEYTCPSHAIRFYENKEGFGYPTVNMMSCTSCGTCAAVCPMEHPLYMYGEKYTYAAYDTREEALKKAASGGLFGLLGEAVLRLGGVVCGCANDENLLPHHIFAEDLEHLDLLKKTKLAESDLTGIYPAVADYLERGRPVLFSGTPCQVAGLRAYLNKIHGTRDEENLYLVDVICYGVPSRSLFAHHLRYLEKKNGGRIISYTFQPKTRYEWSVPSYRAELKKPDGSVVSLEGICESNPYFRQYLEGNAFRESCYRCPYMEETRPGDITLGDFLGIEEECPEMVHPDGTSLVVVNTVKGNRLFAMTSPARKKRLKYAAGADHQKGLRSPMERTEARDTFYENRLED